MFEVEGRRKKGLLDGTWMRQVEEESMKVGLRREDMFCQPQRIVGVDLISTMHR